jgi:hypothetical protein
MAIQRSNSLPMIIRGRSRPFDGPISLIFRPFFSMVFSAFHLRRLRNDTEVRNLLSYPDQHIDSDCFFADLPLFRALLHTQDIRRTLVELTSSSIS